MGGAFTLDLAGRGRFGGDIEWVDTPDYIVNAARKPAAVEGIRRYWPQVDARRLVPDYAGVRPRTWGPNDPPGDWCILGPRQSGVPGLVHLLGIETPGLTACLAIAEHVLRILD
jgi:D-amino-acid oxidase